MSTTLSKWHPHRVPHSAQKSPFELCADLCERHEHGYLLIWHRMSQFNQHKATAHSIFGHLVMRRSLWLKLFSNLDAIDEWMRHRPIIEITFMCTTYDWCWLVSMQKRPTQILSSWQMRWNGSLISQKLSPPRLLVCCQPTVLSLSTLFHSLFCRGKFLAIGVVSTNHSHKIGKFIWKLFTCRQVFASTKFGLEFHIRNHNHKPQHTIIDSSAMSADFSLAIKQTKLCPSINYKPNSIDTHLSWLWDSAVKLYPNGILKISFRSAYVFHRHHARIIFGALEFGFTCTV